MGTLVICATIMYTNSNPIMVGLATTSALYIGHMSEGKFSPLNVFIKYSIGRLSLNESLKYLAVQLSAAIMIGITYIET
jgi:hypothetical protein